MAQVIEFNLFSFQGCFQSLPAGSKDATRLLVHMKRSNQSCKYTYILYNYCHNPRHIIIISVAWEILVNSERMLREGAHPPPPTLRNFSLLNTIVQYECNKFVVTNPSKQRPFDPSPILIDHNFKRNLSWLLCRYIGSTKHYV